MVKTGEAKSIGIGSALVLVNIGLMAGFSEIGFLTEIFNWLWQWPIVGVIVFGAFLTVGNFLGRRGIKNGDAGLATLGVFLLMSGYGIFGAGIIAGMDLMTKMIVLGVTGVITTFIAVLAALYVYWTDRNLSKTGRYANYAFLGVIAAAFAGTFFAPIVLIAFVLALIGFLLYLVYEIWRMKMQKVDPVLSGLGLYIAYAGVFVQVLQLVAREYLER